MRIRKLFQVMMFLALALGLVWAQGDATPAPAGQAPDSSQSSANTPPPAAFGQDNAPPQSAENPPISGLDEPSLEPGALARSFLIPGVHVSQALDTNVNGSTGSSSYHGVTSALGSLALQKLWSRYQGSLDYVGGASFYSGRGFTATQVQDLSIDTRYLWRTGQLAVRDAFSYLPEGSFGFGSYGGAGAISGIGGIGGPLSGGGVGGVQNGFFGPGQFASLGQQPRISNVALVDITKTLSPRSSVTAAGSYGLVHFVNSPPGFLNSRQVSAQGGYNYLLNKKDQLGVVYGYQTFRYPSVLQGNLNTNLVNVLWGHRLSGRMDLVLGGGPQFTRSSSPLFGSNTRISGSGRASLRYRFPLTSVSLSYNHYNTSGSGFFVGAKSDVARLSASRPFFRVWNVTADIGYTHDSRIVPVVILFSPINNARSYNYIYAGGSVRRQLGRDFSAFLSYQYNNLNFDQSFCINSTSCARTSQRSVVVFGIDWHPHPIRLD